LRRRELVRHPDNSIIQRAGLGGVALIRANTAPGDPFAPDGLVARVVFAQLRLQPVTPGGGGSALTRYWGPDRGVYQARRFLNSQASGIRKRTTA